MDIDDIQTYIQQIEDTAADMRSALENVQDGTLYEGDRWAALDELLDYAQQTEGHALDIIDIIKKSQE